MSEQYPPAPASSTPPQAPQYTFPPQDQPVSGYQGSPTPSTPGSGMAIGAMVLGILGILSFWVPVFNIGAILLAIVGVILGVLAIRGIKRGTQSGKGMAIAGIVLSALTIVGAIVVNVATFAFVKSIEEQTTADLDDAIADLDSAGEPAAEEPPADAEVLPLGESAEVGDYTVTVTSVTLDGNEIVAGANEFNEPPTNQYVVVELDVTYNGTEEAQPYLDLSVVFDGADARQYDESTCMAYLPKDGTDVPTLTTGGQASYQTCMDVPAEAMDGARLFVEPTFSMDEVRAYWAVQ